MLSAYYCNLLEGRFVPAYLAARRGDSLLNGAVVNLEGVLLVYICCVQPLKWGKLKIHSSRGSQGW